MTAPSRIELTWGDGEHVFNLAIPDQVQELEEKCGCGVREVFNRLREDRWKLSDVRETIRIALIGGGKKPAEATILVRRYVDNRPLAESVLVAQIILMAVVVGIAAKAIADTATEAATTADNGSIN